MGAPLKLMFEMRLPIVCCGPKANQVNGPQVMEIIAGLGKTYDHYFYMYGGAQNISGCGTWGDNNFSDNLNYRHYLNISRVVRPLPERVPSEEEIFGDYWRKYS